MKTLILTVILCSIVSIGSAQYWVEGEKLETSHPIDLKYDGKLDFMGSNAEMEENIASAEADWRALMEKKLALLLEYLPQERKNKLIKSQKLWQEAWEADRDFFFNDGSEIRYLVGREGEILSEMEFMHRVRKRALDLSAYVKIFIPEGVSGQ